MIAKKIVGQIPGKPQGGRHGMVFGQISSSSVIGNIPQKPLVPGQREHHTLNNSIHFSLFVTGLTDFCNCQNFNVFCFAGTKSEEIKFSFPLNAFLHVVIISISRYLLI